MLESYNLHFEDEFINEKQESYLLSDSYLGWLEYFINLSNGFFSFSVCDLEYLDINDLNNMILFQQFYNIFEKNICDYNLSFSEVGLLKCYLLKYNDIYFEIYKDMNSEFCFGCKKILDDEIRNFSYIDLSEFAHKTINENNKKKFIK